MAMQLDFEEQAVRFLADEQSFKEPWSFRPVDAEQQAGGE